jgi:mycothiol synthase
MTLQVEPWTEADHDLVRGLLSDPSIASQYDMLLGPGRLEHWLADPLCLGTACLVARADGALAGFAYGFLIGRESTPWAMLRPAVLSRWRRRGIGSRLLETQIDAVRSAAPTCREVCIAAYEPSPEAHGFATFHGFRQARRFWLMTRTRDDLQDPVWPAGIVTRLFVPGEAAVRDWTDAYNASFARHYHFARTSYEVAGAMAAAKDFDPTSLLLAYSGERCVGFVRDEVHAERGEVGVIGVVPEFQGRGLGRALLRWGVRRLAELGARPVTLLVDGDNENALGLYRSEGFEVTRTRIIWSRSPNLSGPSGA